MLENQQDWRKDNLQFKKTVLQLIFCEGIVAAVGLFVISYFLKQIAESYGCYSPTWRCFLDGYPNRLTHFYCACVVCLFSILLIARLTLSPQFGIKSSKMETRIRVLFLVLFGIGLIDLLLLMFGDFYLCKVAL